MSKDLYDVVIVGGGPAGLTAAIYLARAKYRVVVVEKEKFGGQITITDEVVNYPGVEKISGTALTESMRKQAENYGAEFMLASVDNIDNQGDYKVIHTSKGILKTYGIIIATGARPRKIGFKGESEFTGRGVAYCATCDGEFFTNKEVYVIGGGFAAAEEAVFLTKYASHVTMLIREPDFTCAKSVADHARKHNKITIYTEVEVDEVSGKESLNYIRYHDINTKEVFEVNSTSNIGVFVFAGYEPESTLVKDLVAVNPQGYVITDSEQNTSVGGIMAAGDICIKELRQVVTATSDGAIAAGTLEKYVSKMHNKTKIIPTMVTTTKTMEHSVTDDSELITNEMKAQLNQVFSRMNSPITLKLELDEREVSKELKRYMEEIVSLTDKLSIEIVEPSNPELPLVSLYKENKPVGISFHGVPGGHEFTSFILGIYNASGPGQPIDKEDYNKIKAINTETKIKILVSLSCTMCPDLVIAAEKIASENELITVDVFDITHFEAIKDKYNVMSVPCMIINDQKIHFGKKSISQILELL